MALFTTKEKCHLSRYLFVFYPFGIIKQVKINSACIIILLTSFLISCADTYTISTAEKNISANWNSETSTLNVSGEGESIHTKVEIRDAANNRFLGEGIIKNDGSWAISTTSSACQVLINLPTPAKNTQTDNRLTIKVNNAPVNCIAKSSGLSGRAIPLDELPVNITVVSNPVLNDTIPNAVILEPAQNMNIISGNSINFKGAAVGVGVAPPFSYRWDFNGAAPNSGIQNPGSILFNTPGTYFISLAVTDNLGIPDPTPATVTITVSDPNIPVSQPPVPNIFSPSTINNNVSISVGDALFFSGTANNDKGAVDFMFEWDFSGVVANQFGATPGTIFFLQAGVYLVNLYATDAQGLRSPIPATITVTVNDTGINQSPSGSIIDPANDIVLTAGDTINFTGLGVDPDNNAPLFYSWNFQGVAPSINMNLLPSTGPVTFQKPGIFTITMTVTDALGQADANPPSRIIIVQNNTLPPLASGTIQSQIISPPQKIEILPGESVYFSGEIIGDINNEVSQYLWDFDGGAVSNNLLTPGDISFALPGKYTVFLYALDDKGVVIGEPAQTVIKVHDPSKVEAEIESPANKQIILVDQAILLDGQVEHLLGGTVTAYEWRIKAHGANDDLFNSTLLAPGNFIFSEIGKYHVYFTISGVDSLGATFERVDKVTVNVVIAPPAVTPPVTAPVTAPPSTTPAPVSPVVIGSPIMEPSADMVITAGDSINFKANSVDPAATNVTYRWDFSGVSAPSNLASPAAIIFNSVGDFTVTLRISGLDQNGVAFDIFDFRTITVMANNSAPLTPPQSPPQTPPQSPPVNSPTPLPIPANPPTGLGGISVPPSDMMINPGDTIGFRGVVIEASSVSYLWDFSGVAPVYTGITPPPVQFNTAGTYLISLTITGTHVTGAPVNIFEQRVITVVPTGQPAPLLTSQPTQPSQPAQTNSTKPEGFIIKPETAMINVKVGQAVIFAGAGFDPLGLGPLRFQWNFGGTLTNIQTQTPGTMTFNRVGTQVVTLLVKNAVGEFDPTPATVIVTVSP